MAGHAGRERVQRSEGLERRDAPRRRPSRLGDSATVGDPRYEPQRVDFTPEVTQPALAKGIGGGMVGFALLTVLSLLWMWVHVHRRGHFGRKTSAVLRSLYPVVLGLGGWFAGVLLVTTTMETTPIDS